jgi:tetratricopeptide (TPR) repeat protein
VDKLKLQLYYNHSIKLVVFGGKSEEAIQYFKKVYSIAEKKSNINYLRRTAMNLSLTYCKIGEFNSSLLYAYKCEELSGEKDYLVVITANSVKSKNYYHLGKVEESIEYCSRSLDLAKKKNQSLYIINNLNWLSYLELDRGNIELSLSYCEESLEKYTLYNIENRQLLNEKHIIEIRLKYLKLILKTCNDSINIEQDTSHLLDLRKLYNKRYLNPDYFQRILYINLAIFELCERDCLLNNSFIQNIDKIKALSEVCKFSKLIYDSSKDIFYKMKYLKYYELLSSLK